MSAEKYRLRITAGPSYSTSTHTPVPVNTSTPLTITTPHATTTLFIRLRDFRASPSSPAPPTHTYFTHPSHTSDLYSFSLHFTPTTPIPGDALIFGNDFDKPIRDSLPMGFSVLWNAAKWVDPGLQGDVYADEPWIFGPALSSMNVISVRGPGTPPPSEIDVEEGEPQPTEVAGGDVVDGNAVLVEDTRGVSRPGLQIPTDQKARSRFFLDEAKRREVVFEKGYTWGFDFYGAWLDFNEFKLKLPGTTMNLLNYWDGQPVRYVLKNKESGDVYAVILLEFEEIKEEGDAEEQEGGNDDID